MPAQLPCESVPHTSNPVCLCAAHVSTSVHAISVALRAISGERCATARHQTPSSLHRYPPGYPTPNGGCTLLTR